jgi:prepilin peptidase CpaA
MASESWYFTVAALSAFLIAVAVMDLSTRRIPNRLTVPAAVLAVAIHAAAAGAPGALHSAEGLAVGLAVFLPMFLAGGSGGGDVKAMAVVGAFLGPAGAFFAILWTLVVGLFGGLIVLVSTAGPAGVRELLRRWIFRGYVLCMTGHGAQLPHSGAEGAAQRFPYGLAIAGGTLISGLWSAYRG